MKIETYSNWCHFDRLDGVDLVDGDRLIITFPDGKERLVKAIVQREDYTTYEQGGHHTNIPVRRAYAETSVWGVPVKLPLAGLEARRASSAWQMKVEESFNISGRGRVLTGRPIGDPFQGPATLTLSDGRVLDVEVIGVEVISIERFMKLMDPPIPGDNVGLLVRGIPHDITTLLTSIIVG